MGVDSRLAGDIEIDLGVTELEDETKTFGRMNVVARGNETNAARAFGHCAGMARYWSRVERGVGLPVVDPAQAAVGFAITATSLGHRHARPLSWVAERAPVAASNPIVAASPRPTSAYREG